MFVFFVSSSLCRWSVVCKGGISWSGSLVLSGLKQILEMNIDVASMTQLRMCMIKIVNFHSSKFFPLREVPILKRDAIEENH